MFGRLFRGIHTTVQAFAAVVATYISVSYAGEWYGLVSKVQPTLIDADFRQSSQERIILQGRLLIAQRHLGPKGSKQVIRPAGDVQVFYNDVPADNRDVLAAAALVADGYRMFLTGPFYFLDSNLSLEMSEDENVEGRPCRTLIAVRRPGHGDGQRGNGARAGGAGRYARRWRVARDERPADGYDCGAHRRWLCRG